jgi:hypothetical protein
MALFGVRGSEMEGKYNDVEINGSLYITMLVLEGPVKASESSKARQAAKRLPTADTLPVSKV